MTRLRTPTAAVVLTVATVLCARSSEGVEPRVRVMAGAAHSVTSPQKDEFGWGALGSLAGEIRLIPALSLHLAVEELLLSAGTPPGNNLASPGTGRAFLGLGGARFYPVVLIKPGVQPNPWIAFEGGFAHTGGRARAAFSGSIGFDFWMKKFALGPFIAYRQVVQPDDELRGEDARILVGGIQGVWSPARRLLDEDLDWDKDGIPNDKDACPREPEDFDGFEDTDGCPDPDNDKDGIPDKVDKCPDEPEDFDGFEDTDGCPDVDNDKDGILDKRDKCPNDPEDFDGFEDEDGCPDPDNDKDEIPDAVDKCPNEPETFNGYADEDGCPDEISVRVVGTRIFLDDRIYFEWNRAVIRKESHSLVERIATLLKNHPEYVQISIEGHTDEMGGADYNRRLSDARANAVRDFLIHNGVEADRLVAVGFGETRPLVQGKSEKAAQINRRVEFVITKRRTSTGTVSQEPTPETPPSYPPDSPTGTPTAPASKSKPVDGVPR